VSDYEAKAAYLRVRKAAIEANPASYRLDPAVWVNGFSSAWQAAHDAGTAKRIQANTEARLGGVLVVLRKGRDLAQYLKDEALSPTARQCIEDFLALANPLLK